MLLLRLSVPSPTTSWAHLSTVDMQSETIVVLAVVWLSFEGGTIEAIFLTLAHKLIRQRPMMPVPMMASLELNENLHRANVISITRSPKQADEVSEAPCGC
ncbi:hypothetical protein J6590_102307 [Homalodisca vitripennis]|nr:hypothetical protein J6590_102307 [Homalodisca vitripennis]